MLLPLSGKSILSESTLAADFHCKVCTLIQNYVYVRVYTLYILYMYIKCSLRSPTYNIYVYLHTCTHSSYESTVNLPKPFSTAAMAEERE